MTSSDISSMTAEEDAAFAAMAAADTPAEAEEEQELPEAEEGAVEPAQAAARKPTTVPHQALHAEREEHKKTRSALEQEKRDRAADMARLDERLRIIQQVQTPQEQAKPAAEVPDPETDPIGFLKHVQQQQKAEAERSQQTQAQQRDAQERQAFVNDYVGVVDEYRKSSPEFQDAYNFALNARASELSFMGMSPMQVKQALENEELGLALAAVKAGRHPGDQLMEYAKLRGWKAKPKPNEAAEQIARLADGVRDGKSLSQAGGSASPGQMTASQLLKMSAEDFDTWTSKHPAQTKRLMGA